MAEGVVVRKKRSVRWLLVAGVLLAILAFGWCSQGDNMGSDAEFERIIAPILPAPPAPVAREDNWYYVLMDQSLQGLDSDEPIWGRSENQVLMQSAILAAEKIGRKPKFQIPPDRLHFPPTGDRVRWMCDAVTRRTFNRFRNGDWRGGLADMELVRHIVKTYRQSTSLSEWAWADQIELGAMQALHLALTEGTIPRDVALKLAQPSQDDSPNVEAKAIIQAHRRSIVSSTLEDLRLGPENYRRHLAELSESDQISFFEFRFRPQAEGMIFGRYQRIPTAKRYVEMIQAFEQDLAEPKLRNPLRSRLIQEQAARQLPVFPVWTAGSQMWIMKGRAMLFRLKIRSNPNSFGLTVCSLADLSIDRTVQTWRAATRILAAISVYRADHGTPPRTLDELVMAKILPSVPVDPQFGIPFHYDRAWAKLWTADYAGREYFVWSTRR